MLIIIDIENDTIIIEFGCLLIIESIKNHINNDKLTIIFNIVRFFFIIIIIPFVMFILHLNLHLCGQ